VSLTENPLPSEMDGMIVRGKKPERFVVVATASSYQSNLKRCHSSANKPK
jgi:hypothetical protein